MKGNTTRPEQYAFFLNNGSTHNGKLALFHSVRDEKIAGWGLWSTRDNDFFQSIASLNENLVVICSALPCALPCPSRGPRSPLFFAPVSPARHRRTPGLRSGGVFLASSMALVFPSSHGQPSFLCFLNVSSTPLSPSRTAFDSSVSRSLVVVAERRFGHE